MGKWSKDPKNELKWTENRPLEAKTARNEGQKSFHSSETLCVFDPSSQVTRDNGCPGKK